MALIRSTPNLLSWKLAEEDATHRIRPDVPESIKIRPGVLAAPANKANIQPKLRNPGIEIPEDTWLIAGEHKTTANRVTLFDLEELPETHRPDVMQLHDLEAARLLNARERCSRLPRAPHLPSPWLPRAMHGKSAATGPKSDRSGDSPATRRLLLDAGR